MTEKIYVVTEDVGEWSDHTTSIMCVCATEQLAQTKVLEFTEYAKLKALTNKQLEVLMSDYYESNPRPLTKDFHPDEYNKKCEEWYFTQEKFEEDEFERISKTIDVSTLYLQRSRFL